MPERGRPSHLYEDDQIEPEVTMEIGFSKIIVVDNIPVIDDTAVLVVDSLISDNNEVVVDIKTIDKSDE